MPEQKKIRLAILDMYENAPNEGMRCIQAIAQELSDFVDWEVFQEQDAESMLKILGY